MILTVSQLNGYARKKISNDPILGKFQLKGEISNFKYHASGHMYFTIKDEESSVRAVMFREANKNLNYLPADGMKVMISGRASIYERDGQFQIYVNDMLPDGIGELYKAYEELKKKLNNEGLFDEDKKKPIPYMPKKIGVITSPSGAAVRDIINVIKRRSSGTEILVIPVLVQGNDASKQITMAIEYANKRNDIDIIIVGRGGGSLEDLWSFNEENVARAISNSEKPVISAVGHETDTTISDMVSDLRAPTPSAAGELAVPDFTKIKAYYDELSRRHIKAMDRYMMIHKERAIRLTDSAILAKPEHIVLAMKQRFDNLLNKLLNNSSDMLTGRMNELKVKANALNIMNPLKVLARGYAVVVDDSKKAIVSVNGVEIGQPIGVLLKDGRIDCSVTSIEKGE